MRASALAALAWLAAGGAMAQEAATILSSAGSWDLRRSRDGTAEASDCILTPKPRSRIEVGRDRLVVASLPRNSIFNFQYRIDDEPASTPAPPSEAMQSTGTVVLDGAAFDRILHGRRFQVRILDRWHEAVTEDVDLAGLAELHGTLAEACR